MTNSDQKLITELAYKTEVSKKAKRALETLVEETSLRIHKEMKPKVLSESPTTQILWLIENGLDIYKDIYQSISESSY